MTLFIIIALLAILVAVVAAVLAVMRAQTTRYARLYNLIVSNTGNMRSRYQLESNDPSGAMVYNFMLNGTLLGPANDATGATGASGASVHSAKDAVNVANTKVQAARFNAGAVTQTIGGMLSEIGYLIPGSLGQSIRNMSMQVRGVDNQIQRVQMTTGRATRLASIASDTADTAGRLTGAGQNNTGAAAISGNAAPADDRTLTPYIEPGAQLQVQLLVSPVDRRKIRSTSFTVLSRSIETADAEVVMQQGVVDYANLSNTRYIALYVLIGLGAAAALWFLSFVVGMWGR